MRSCLFNAYANRGAYVVFPLMIQETTKIRKNHVVAAKK